MTCNDYCNLVKSGRESLFLTVRFDKRSYMKYEGLRVWADRIRWRPGWRLDFGSARYLEGG